MPSVEFDVTLTNGEETEVHNPSDMPDPGTIEEIREPFIKAQVIAPKEYVGAIMELCQERRGEHVGMHYLSPERVQMTYDLPLAEIVLDFFDQLKSRTRGYASLDYELNGVRPSDLVKLDVLLAGDPVDALSMVVHREKAYEMGRTLTEKLRKRIPRQQYDVPIQAAIGSHVIARETVKAFRKDVIAGCYGGDITRKKKLLAKQKEGKKRMKQVGRISQLGPPSSARLGPTRPLRCPACAGTPAPAASSARAATPSSVASRPPCPGGRGRSVGGVCTPIRSANGAGCICSRGWSSRVTIAVR
jgi:GTP-binding protein LepA